MVRKSSGAGALSGDPPGLVGREPPLPLPTLYSHLFFAHVRSATGTAVTRQNCHPFGCGRWMFMHNGFIGSWNRLRRRVESMIPDAYYPSRLGTTDSEAVFLAMMGAGLDADPVGAARRLLRQLCGVVNEEGHREHLRVPPPP